MGSAPGLHVGAPLTVGSASGLCVSAPGLLVGSIPSLCVRAPGLLMGSGPGLCVCSWSSYARGPAFRDFAASENPSK